MTFPNIRPSSRTFTPGDWPVKTFNAVNGSEFRILRGSNRTSAKLSLEFKNIPDSQARLFLQDYYARQGTFKSWNFDAASARSVFHGWDASAVAAEGDTTVLEAFPYGMQWRYEAEPEIEQVRTGISTVRVKLIGIITSALATVAITPTISDIASTTPILDKGILLDGTFLYKSSSVIWEGSRAIAGRMPFSYYARTVPFGQGNVPGLKWYTDEDWTVADLSRINTWRLICYRDIIDDEGRNEEERNNASSTSLAQTPWDYPGGAELRVAERKFGTGPIFNFASTPGAKRQTLMEVHDIPADANVTSGSWTRKQKELPDFATSLPSTVGNDWTGARVYTPSTIDTWAESRYDTFRASYPPVKSVTVPGGATKDLWAGPQARLGNSPTRYFFVVLALDSSRRLLSLGSLVFTAPNVSFGSTTWPPSFMS